MSAGEGPPEPGRETNDAKRRFRLNYRFADYGHVVIEAASESDARAVLDKIDGGLLPTDDESGDWTVTSVEETRSDLTWPDGPPADEEPA